MTSKTEDYQTKWGNLEAAQTEARHQSKLIPNTDYSIIESTTEGMGKGTKVFYVETEMGIIRAWETYHGYYLNGKHHK